MGMHITNLKYYVIATQNNYALINMLKIELSFFRCTRFRFGPLQENQIVPRLEHVATTENVEVTEDGKKALIALSGGDMRKVNNFIDMLL